MSSTMKKKAGLGRGLGALLENANTDITTSFSGANTGNVAMIPISSIEANPWQPRSEFEQTALNELAESIKVHGVIQPITVRKMGYDRYQLISGERRTRASLLGGLTEIPAFIRVANDQDMLEMALIENIQRSDLNAIEVALSYKRLLEECNLKQEELGERVGKDRTTVNNYLRLLKLPEPIQRGIQLGKVSMGHARAMINMDDAVAQMELYEQIIREELSVREVESLVKAKKNGETLGMSLNGTDWDPEIDRITAAFYEKLRAAVHLKTSGKGKGKIIISYKSKEDLERILGLIGQ
ncbi:MAG: ParB/RepB/Spo0J family partition protein [Bacteroidetes bacterium]|nr:ParB/RepB/Spo0J family partition protein [Bacteroidota bacterium]